MCGIAGFIDFTKQTYILEDLRSMTDALSNRGPDGSGYKLIPTPYANIGFGHRRLSIIDLSDKASQPMHDTFFDSWITFNGEIYNYKELKSKYFEGSKDFISSSDTEVLLKLFENKGIACLNELSGMFAFVIYSSRSNKVWLVRDPLGVKPLYYSFENNCLQFASELRSFHAKFNNTLTINKKAVKEYLRLGYINAPNSIYKNIYKLDPGSYLELDLGTGSRQLQYYWNLDDQFTRTDERSDEAIYDDFKKYTDECFCKRLVADVEVSSFLSGGIDSSLVTSVISKKRPDIKTFTIGFNEVEFNESGYAKKIAHELDLENYVKYISAKDCLSYVQLLPQVYDEPLADNSCIPSVILCEFARESVKVVLSSDGGDEAFFGYNKFLIINKIFTKFPNKYLRWCLGILLSLLVPVSNLFENFIYNVRTRIMKLKNILLSDNYLSALQFYESVFDPIEIDKLTGQEEEVPTLKPINNGNKESMMWYSYKYYLPSILAKLDRASMYNSLEVREPMLDKEFVELVAKMPFHLKFNNGKSKVLLRKYLLDFMDKSFFERPKKGFNIPVYKWLKNELYSEWSQLLHTAKWEELGIVNPEPIYRLDKKLRTGKPINADKLWNVYILLKWYDYWHIEK